MNINRRASRKNGEQEFFSPLETSNRGRFITGAAPFIYFGYGLYYLLAIAGMVMTAKNWRSWLLPYLLIAYFTSLAAVLYGGTRYSIPIQPFLMVFAAQAIVSLAAHLRAVVALPTAPLRRR